MATMKDVARFAGVSIATVSSTLSGRSFVSAELKQRVETAIRELGYAPNAGSERPEARYLQPHRPHRSRHH